MPDSQPNPSRPLVSVITVSFNCAEFLKKCLASLRAQTYPHVEVIVVDNGSREDIAAAVKKEYPGAVTLRLETNAGFAAGNNVGIRHARGTYIALINNDAIADPEWLEQMVAMAESDASIGAVAARAIDGNDPTLLDSCGVVIALDGMSRQAMNGISSQAILTSQSVLAFSGCACLLRAEALKQSGLFDERYFAYCEDTDLSLRLLWTGWNIQSAPAATVTHFYSKTGGAFSLRKVFWIERNHYWVSLKNFPLSLAAALPIFSAWRVIYQAYAMCRGYGKLNSFVNTGGVPRLLWTLFTANLAAAAGLMAVLASRLDSRKNRVRTSTQMRRLIFDHHASMKEIIAGAAKI